MFIITGIIFIVFAIVLIVVFLMQGDVTTSGVYPGTKITESISCVSNNYLYPFLKYDNAQSKKFTFNLVLDNNMISSISISQKLNYSETNLTNTSEAQNHAAMNLRFQSEGLGADAFNAVYSKLQNGLQINYYASNRDINSQTAKYFLLEELNIDSAYDSQKILDLLTKKGLDCEHIK